MAGKIYRIVRWIVLVMLILAILLVLRKSRPPQVEVSQAAKDSLQVKLEEEQKATDAKQPHELKMNEAELNSMLASNLALAPGSGSTPSSIQSSTPAAQTTSAPPAQTTNPPPAAATPPPAKEPTIQEVQSTVKDVKVGLVDDRVRAYVVFAFHGTDLSLELEGRLNVRDGYLRFTPTGGKLGSLPLPSLALDNAVHRLFESEENAEKFKLPPEISDIHVSQGQLVVSYK